MGPDEFKKAWETPGAGPLVEWTLAIFPESYLAGASIPDGAKHFLRRAGLPADAAPFLSFGPCHDTSWNLPDCMEIGFNGSGDPIAITPDGSVFYFNHDADLAGVYINKDVEALAEALLKFRAVVAGRGKGDRQARDDFVQFLSNADPRALAPGSMWARELPNFT